MRIKEARFLCYYNPGPYRPVNRFAQNICPRGGAGRGYPMKYRISP